MLVTRSPAESHLYLDLHPHDCGEAQFTPDHWLEDRDGQMVSVYQGTCPRCGRPRRVEFALADLDTPPAHVFGGAAPSQIIDPGEFLHTAVVTANAVPVNVDLIPPERRDWAIITLRQAVAALEEVAKFIPPGADSVPPQAFTSALGRSTYDASPSDFTRDRIAARIQHYRDTLDSFQRFLAQDQRAHR